MLKPTASIVSRLLAQWSPSLREVAASTSWLTAESVVRLGIGLLVSIAIARQLGPALYGLYNLATAIAAICGALIPLAADSVVIRELVARPTERGRILASHVALRGAGSLAAFALGVGCAWALYRDQPTAFWLILVVSGSLLFQPADAVGTWFQAALRPRPVVVVKTGAFLLGSVARLVLVLLGAPLLLYGVSLLAEAALAAVGLILVFRASEQIAAGFKPSRPVLMQLLRDSWPLLLSGISSLLYLRLDVVMLTSMRDAYEVGLYGAVTRLSEAWYFVPMALSASVQPLIFRARKHAHEDYLAKLRLVYKFFAWSAILVAGVISGISAQLVSLLFGEEYRAAGPILAVHVWAAVAVFLGVASSQYLVAENLAKISMIRTALGLAVNVALNLVLIPPFGALGAAVATLISYFVATFSILLIPRTREQGLEMLKALNPWALIDLARWVRVNAFPAR